MARKFSPTEHTELEALSDDRVVLEDVAAGSVATLSLPTYADDAAAGVGGLTAGKLYKTATGAVMVKL